LQLHIPSIISNKAVRDRQIQLLSAVIINQNSKIENLSRRLSETTADIKKAKDNQEGKRPGDFIKRKNFEKYTKALADNKDEYIYILAADKLSSGNLFDTAISDLKRLGMEDTERLRAESGLGSVMIIDQGNVVLSETNSEPLFKWQKLRDHSLYVETRIDSERSYRAIIIDDIVNVHSYGPGMDVIVLDKNFNKVDCVRFLIKNGAFRSNRYKYE